MSDVMIRGSCGLAERVTLATGERIAPRTPMTRFGRWWRPARPGEMVYGIVADEPQEDGEGRINIVPTTGATMTRLRPIGDRILIRVRPAQDKTPGGIFIPDRARPPCPRGEVLAVGPGKRLPDGTLVPLDVRVGDVVIFNNGLAVDGEPDVLAIVEANIVAVVEG